MLAHRFVRCGLDNHVRLGRRHGIDPDHKGDAVLASKREARRRLAAAADRSHLDARAKIAATDVLKEQAGDRSAAENCDAHGGLEVKVLDFDTRTSLERRPGSPAPLPLYGLLWLGLSSVKLCKT